MSIGVLNEVWQHAAVDGGTLLVLLALADCADEKTRTCYPGVKALAKKARLSERQVQYCLRRLRKLGIIATKRNASPVKTNLYSIAPVEAWDAARDAVIAPRLPKAETQLMQVRDAVSCASEAQPVAPKSSGTVRVEPSESAREKGEADHFGAFWAAYPAPGRKSKRAVERKFAGVVSSGVSADRIIAAAARYAGSENVARGFTKHAITWLNQGCWDDEYGEPHSVTPSDFWTGEKVYS